MRAAGGGEGRKCWEDREKAAALEEDQLCQR